MLIRIAEYLILYFLLNFRIFMATKARKRKAFFREGEYAK